MQIVAIARHVPDSRVAVRIRTDGSGLETQGMKFVCEPFDEIGIEQAVQLKAAGCAEAVLVISVGPEAATDALRHGIAMGADRAVHILCEDIPAHEEVRMAKFCAAALHEIDGGAASVDDTLILCGARSTDNGAGELGPAVAEFLGIPHAGAVIKLEPINGAIRVNSRSVAGGEVVFDLRLPAVITCERGLAEPRHPALPKLMKAKKHQIEQIAAKSLTADEPCQATLTKLASPPSRQACRFLDGEPEEMARELIRILREEAKAL